MTQDSINAPSLAMPHDPHRLGRGAGEANPAQGHGEGGPASRRLVSGFGFWIFLLSDMVMFAVLFATFAVLRDATAGGPGGRELFDIPNVAVETVLLLLSSFTCGYAMLAAGSGDHRRTRIWLAVTILLGFCFLVLELREFANLIADGAGPQRSAFLSAFFALVGCHGLHVTAGLLWAVMLIAQIATQGLHPALERRLLCFSLFWHALDIIWVAVLTLVYLVGVSQ
ncbi:cytochrome o ubiquinol oxidase subunit III [Sphingopyxis sp. LARHCG72]